MTSLLFVCFRFDTLPDNIAVSEGCRCSVGKCSLFLAMSQCFLFSPANSLHTGIEINLFNSCFAWKGNINNIYFLTVSDNEIYECKITIAQVRKQDGKCSNKMEGLL